jgi:deazaflavin-dependent oxidoreductase (nitroreductase family)
MTQLRHLPRGISIFNAISKPLLAAGVPMGYNGLLTVTGRKSGEPRTAALAIIERDGRRWVWSPWGEVNWVRNLRAAGHATVTVRKRSEAVRAVELDDAERLRFFEDTLQPIARGLPGGTAFLRLLDGIDINDPVAAAEGKVVFELQPAASPG